MAGNAASVEVYAQHVGGLLEGEYERRKTLEARGGSIITTSAAVIALIFSLTVFISGKDYKYTNHLNSIYILGAALLAFVVSATIAIYVQSWGLKYTITGKKTLLAMTQGLWDLPSDDAKRMCLQRLVNTTLTMREGNDRKAVAAQYSVIVQVVAVILLGLSLIFELTGDPQPAESDTPTETSVQRPALVQFSMPVT
ncbi:hypothetical protein [Mycolicibacterium sp. S3B2]|uniref:hypothetical protein n=1 Tax=Mycolicibacterium sp. S3B2 TaxID=3415120 RepID=UPI003C79F4D4